MPCGLVSGFLLNSAFTEFRLLQIEFSLALWFCLFPYFRKYKKKSSLSLLVSAQSSPNFHNHSSEGAFARAQRKSWCDRAAGLAEQPCSGGRQGALCLLKCCLGSSPRWAVSQGSYCALPFFAVEEIEQMNSLFQQKQRELVLAVSKVEELTRQLEMLKNGRIDGYHDNQSAVAELDRLYKELQVMGGQPVTLSSKSWLGCFLPYWKEIALLLFLPGLCDSLHAEDGGLVVLSSR